MNNRDKALNYMRLQSLQSLQSRVCFAHTAFANPTPKNGYHHYLALPTHHPEKDSEIVIERIRNRIKKNTIKKKSRSAWNATAANGRFDAMAAVARRQFCENLHVIIPQKVQWKPPLRQAAGTL